MTPQSWDVSPHIKLGQTGENVAAAILQQSGYTILERNWRHERLELDLICELQGEIIFVEIKTRKKNAYGGGPGAITKAKINKLSRAAQFWLNAANRWDSPCRFDVICLYGANGVFRMEHYPNAFSLDCSDSSWQSG